MQPLLIIRGGLIIFRLVDIDFIRVGCIFLTLHFVVVLITVVAVAAAAVDASVATATAPVVVVVVVIVVIIYCRTTTVPIIPFEL